MKDIGYKTKLILFPIFYWIIFIFIPFAVASGIKNYNQLLNLPGVIGFYLLFFAPFLFIIPYKFAKFEKLNQKLIFVFLGLIIPYFVFYIYIYFVILLLHKSLLFSPYKI